jgi:hypothetical protein
MIHLWERRERRGRGGGRDRRDYDTSTKYYKIDEARWL